MDKATVEPVQCKGRNGYFNFGRFSVWHFRNERSYVEIFSRREGRNSPIQFQGTREELLGIFKGIVSKLEATTPTQP